MVSSRTLPVADLGGSFLRVALVDPADPGDPRPRALPTPAGDYPALLAAAARLVAEAAPAPGLPFTIAAAGAVDSEAGTIRAANIPCLAGRPFAADLAEALGRPVHLVNDADAFALAEALIGAGRGHRVVLGAIIGTGIGGGLVADGRLVIGAGGIGGEWGHGPVAPDSVAGRPLPPFACGCGLTGCADAFGSARGIERLHAHLAGMEAGSRAIVDGFRAGSPEARTTVAIWAEMLAGPLALAINLCGASAVPLGGGLGLVPDLRAVLDEAVRARILLRTDDPLLRAPALGAMGGLIGAALLGAREMSGGA